MVFAPSFITFFIFRGFHYENEPQALNGYFVETSTISLMHRINDMTLGTIPISFHHNPRKMPFKFVCVLCAFTHPFIRLNSMENNNKAFISIIFNSEASINIFISHIYGSLHQTIVSKLSAEQFHIPNIFRMKLSSVFHMPEWASYRNGDDEIIILLDKWRNQFR